MSDFLDRIQTLSPKRLALLAYELQSQLEAAEQSCTEAIALVGIGCRFPGGVSDPDAYWQLLQSGRNPITEVPPERWDVDAYYDPDPSTPGKTYTRSGGFLTDVDQFDPDFFGISPREAIHMDPQQRLLLEVSWEALERSGHAPKSLVGSRTGVYVAIGTNDYANLQTRGGDLRGIDAYSGSGNGFCFAAGRISYALGLQGPNMALDAACASSLMAVHLACQSLRMRECELALVGGVNLLLSPETNVAFSRTRVMAADGRCKTFDASADGYVRSEGCAAVVLKRLRDAEADRDPILAVIRGSAMNHGGASGGLTIPNGAAQQSAIGEALAQAKVAPQAIQYVETQGTGTPLGDAIEVRALGAVLKQGRSPLQPLWLASVKTNIGHTETASGLASLIKVALALQHQTLPPHLHLQRLNPEISLADIPAKIPTTLTPWPAGQPRRLAGVNAFGMSGTNAHVIVEAPATKSTAPSVERPHLLPLSAKTPEALRQLVQRYETYLATNADLDIGDVCFTAGVGRSHFAHRIGLIGDSVKALHHQLLACLGTDAMASPVSQPAPKVVFVLPYAAAEQLAYGNVHHLYETNPVFQQEIDQGAKILGKSGTGLIDRREPATTFLITYALAQLWQAWGILPSRIVGAGVGRVVANCLSGQLSLEAALSAVVNNSPQSLDVPEVLTEPTRITDPETAALTEYRLKVNPQQTTWNALLEELSTLYQHGVEVDWAGVYRPYPRRRLSLPTYPFQRQRYWSDLAQRGTQPTAPAPMATPMSRPSAPPLSRAALLAIDPAQRQQRLAADLCDLIAVALGVDPAEITPTVPLNCFALDSIMALELKFDLEKTLGTPIAMTALLDNPDIAALSTDILQTLSADAADAAHPPSDFPPLTPAPTERYQPFPLNEIQEAYWIGRSGLFDMGNVAAHVYAEFEGEGLDCDRLGQAFQQLIQRHDMLRTVILPSGQQQVLETVPPYSLEVLDLRHAAVAVAEQQLLAVRQELSHQIHDAYQWPLFTVRAARLSGQRVRVFLSFDNLLVDGASLGLLCREWGQLYQASPAALMPLTVTFRDYVLALKAFETSEVYQRSLAYWQQRLTELPAAPELPLASQSATVKQPQFTRMSTQLPPAVWQRLQAAAQQAGLTPSALLVAAYGEVLATWSKTRHFSLNLTTFNRLPLHPQVPDIVGDFTSLTLLAIDYCNSDSFWQRAKRVQHQLWQDLEHSYVSGVRVLRELAKTPEAAGRVMMPVVFTSLLANPQLKQASAFSTGWLGELVYSIAQTPQVWLDHQVYEEAGALVLNWDSVQGLFPAGLVDTMFDAYVQLLKALAADPDGGQQQRFNLLPEAQRQQQRDFNATSLPVAEDYLHTLFLSQAERQPQALAVVTEAHKLTYGELQQRSLQLAQALRSIGVKPNQLVAIAMDKGWEQIVAALGILMSGAAYVPIDPTLPQERRWQLLEQSTEADATPIVLTQSWLETTHPWPEHTHMLALDTAQFPAVTEAPLPIQQPTNLAYVIYTSGSTGMPKGVMIDHRGAVNTLLDINRRWKISDRDRVFALSSLSFDLSVYDIFGTLAAGGTLVMPPPQAAKDPALWSEILIREQVTVWNSVPALMQMLVTYAANRPEMMPPSLRLVLLSGDWLPLTLPDSIRTLVPGAQVVSLGGATEASIWSIFYPIEGIDPTWVSIPYGSPLANQQFYVLDSQLAPCPLWVPGQLYIGGIGLAQGYWRNPAKTTASFITHPGTGERLYRTGDLGRYRPSGEIEFLGREDTQVKVGGHRIELGEIETAIEQHPQVARAVVLTAEETQGQQLVAHICLEPEPGGAANAIESDLSPVAAWHHEPADANGRWTVALSAAMIQAAQVPEQFDWQGFQVFWQHLQELYLVAVGKSFHQLGLFTQPGDTRTWEAIRQHSKIHPRYGHWLKRALAYLVQQGHLQQQGAEYTQCLPFPESIPPELLQQLLAEAEQAIGLDTTVRRLLITIVENLADILTENQHSAELYADEAIPEVYEKQFHTSNLVMQRAIATLVQTWKPEGTLHVLEVGAGIGSTTDYILPLLPPDRTQYVFTDISQYFLQLAQQKFAAFPFLETQLLNLEQSPQIQNYSLHSFDLVIASSVLHTTRSIAETLGHIVSLLKPGGILLLLEETQFHAPFDLTMGLQQGFDRFEDTDFRQGHPLLSQGQWQQALLAAGFVASQVLSQSDTIAQWLGFDVFLARGPAAVQSFQSDDLKRYLGQKLPAYMVPQHYLSLDRVPLTANGKIDRRTLQALWPKTSVVQSDYIAPQNAIQQKVVEIWQELLARDPIGIQDNFFELGGDSLVATQVMARIQESFQVEVSLRHLFQDPTVANLADAIVQTLAAQIDPDLINSLETDAEPEAAASQSAGGIV